MARKSLITAARSAAGRCGLAFHTGSAHRINTALGEMPALWLAPPGLVKKEGYREGIATYAVSMTFIDKCAGSSAEETETAWAGMEDTASRIVLMLAAEEFVKSISGVEYLPAEASLTNRGEISLTVKFKADIVFTNKNEE